MYRLCIVFRPARRKRYTKGVFTDFNEDWEKQLLTYNADVRDGYIDLAEDRPGLGAELNMDEIMRHPYNRGNWLPLFKSGWEQHLQVDEV